MNREAVVEQLKTYLRDYVKTVTQRSRGANMYVCPLCGSGTGQHGTGAFSVKQNRWKCFSCGKGGDIFDLYGAMNGTTDFNAQLKGLSARYNLQLDPYPPTEDLIISDFDNLDLEVNTQTHDNIHTHIYTSKDNQGDYGDFFLEAHKAIDSTDYWKKRGLSKKTVDRFCVGYVKEWRHPKAPNAPASPRLIIPTSPFSYLARDTRDNIPKAQQAYSKSKVGSIHFFNKEALKVAKKPVFIVEGEIDALSIIEVGGEAIALGTTTKINSFLELLRKHPPTQPLIISLDNDEAGRKASNLLLEGVQALNIPCYSFNLCGGCKDVNEALQLDREALNIAVWEAEGLHDAQRREEREAYLRNSSLGHLIEFIDGISDSANTPCISTGFKHLDEVLDGGLYEGLYIIGAISSLGKTTFTTQMTDQIAEMGQDVLIFSLEMARTEIMAKSISRHTLKEVVDTDGDIRDAKTARGITTGKRYKNYSEREKDLIAKSLEQYKAYAEHIYISEGIGDIGIPQIRHTINQHIKFTGNSPVVVIDYIQILAPYNERATDKQNIDKAVMELKRISRDFKIPVIGISSFNRANYSVAVTMEAFKESGAIEYSSDVLIGLQLEGAGKKEFDAIQAKKQNPRVVELVILKNRNGRAGDRLGYYYYPMFNYFKER